MTKDEANKLIHEKIMGRTGQAPDYCEDANEAVKVWNHMPPGYSIQGPLYSVQLWCVYIRCSSCIASSDNFCTATAKAALHSLGITEEIEG